MLDIQQLDLRLFQARLVLVFVQLLVIEIIEVFSLFDTDWLDQFGRHERRVTS